MRKKWNKGGFSQDYWRRQKHLAGGGGMALIGIHAINLLPWLAGSPVESVTAFSENLSSRKIIEGDDITVAVARLKNGALASMEACYASENTCVEIYGTRGFAVLHDGMLRIKLDTAWKGNLLNIAGGIQTTFPASALKKLSVPLRCKYEQHEAFARAVIAGGPPPVSGEDGLWDIAVLEAIYRSAQTGKRQTV